MSVVHGCDGVVQVLNVQCDFTLLLFFFMRSFERRSQRSNVAPQRHDAGAQPVRTGHPRSGRHNPRLRHGQDVPGARVRRASAAGRADLPRVLRQPRPDEPVRCRHKRRPRRVQVVRTQGSAVRADEFCAGGAPRCPVCAAVPGRVPVLHPVDHHWRCHHRHAANERGMGFKIFNFFSFTRLLFLSSENQVLISQLSLLHKSWKIIFFFIPMKISICPYGLTIGGDSSYFNVIKSSCHYRQTYLSPDEFQS